MHDAFISYSHQDDGALAPVLQDSLQRIGKPWHRRRGLHVFRDETGLSANPGLWTSLTETLDESEWFILLASPGAAASPWVNQEIEYWLEHKDRAHLLPVLTGGEWAWDDVAGGFDWDRCTAVPAAMRGAFAEEPRHIDLRWARDHEGLSPRHPRLRDQVAEIAAPIHGVTKDELVGTDLREHRRTVRLARGVVVALVLLTLASVVGGVAATRNASRAELAREESDRQRVIAQSRDLQETSTDVSLLLALEAFHQQDSPQSRGALQGALLASGGNLGSVADPSVAGGYWDACPLDSGSTVLTGGEDGTIGFTDLKTSQVLGPRARLVAASDERMPSGYSVSAIGCSTSLDGRSGVVYSLGGRIWTLDAAHSPRDQGHDVGSPLNDVAVSPDGSWLAAGTADGTLLVWRRDTDPRQGRRFDAGVDAVGVAFSADGATLASTASDEIVLWDTATWIPTGRIEDVADNQSGGLVPLEETTRRLAFSPDGSLLASGRRAIVRVLDVATGLTRWDARNNYIDAVPIAWSPDGTVLHLVDASGTIVERRAIDGASVGPDVLAPLGTTDFGLMGDGSTLITWGGDRPVLIPWAVDGHSAISRFLPAPTSQTYGYSPDGATLLVGPAQTSVVAATSAFDDVTLKRIADVPEAAYPQLADATTAAGYFLDELRVDRIDLATGDRIGPSFPIDLTGAVQANNDPHGRILVAHDDDTVRRYEPDGVEVGHPWLRTDGSVLYMELSRRGDLAAVDTPSALTVYRIADGTPAFDAIPGALIGAFTLDGRALGIWRDDVFTFLDTSTGREIGPSLTAATTNQTVHMSSGSVFALAGTNLVELRDRATGELIGDPFPSTSGGFLRPDGLELATASEEGIVLWDLDPDHWQAAACRLAGRNLTRDEWATYFPSDGAYHPTCLQYPPGR